MKKQHIRFASILTALSVFLTIPAMALAAPVAENQELQTYRGISVGGQLVAVTPDDGEVSFTVTTAPSKGTLELQEDGSFVYTPFERSRGRDYFGYRATDAKGQQSREATVIIRLLRQKKDIRYTDTAGLECDYAAHVLAEKKLFTGASILGNALFEPERQISRAEFLSLCMSCADMDLLTAVESTGYGDDENLASWMKPYVATALFEGIGGESSLYNADTPIAPTEAAELVSRCFRVTEANHAENEDPSRADLRSWGIWDDYLDEKESLSRADAAILLVKAMEKRQK